MATSKYDNRRAAGLAKKLISLRSKLKSLRSKLLLHVASLKSLSGTLAQPEVVDLPQPPLHHLLRSNLPPTESETSLVRDIITTAEVEESCLKEMASSHTGADCLASETVRTLSCESDRTRQFIVEHNAILSPIRRIPPEILQNIFNHTRPTTVDDSIPGPRKIRVSQLPWALSQVCRLWRNTMLSFSVMWRDFPAVDLNEACTKEKPYLDFLTEILKRSHNTQIRLVILGNGIEHIDHPAIDMLVLHSDRWQEVKIHALLALLPAFQKIKGRLSSLQSLYLNLCPKDITEPMNNTYTAHDLFRIAPQLQHVDLKGPTNEFIFPTHQLVHYCQTRASLNQVIQVIFSSPSLRIVRFHGFQYAEGSILPMTPLRLPDLIVLDAYFHEWSTYHESFFNNLTIPALEELRVKTYAGNVITPICSMILRAGSSCLLQVLHLQLRFAPGELPRLLRLTPLVTNLTITLPPTRDIFALLRDGNTPPLVPLLDKCEFLSRYNTVPSAEKIQALKLFASSRCELPDNATSTETLHFGEFHPLQTLRIDFGWRSSWYRHHFEGWVYSDMAGELYKQRERLLAMLPELGWRVIPFKRKFDLKWKSRVTGLLTHLETLKVEKASDICLSGIQHILYAISIWFQKRDVGSSFSPIAERILKKWEPILRDDMRDLRWLSTTSSLMYLPTTQNHALSSSPDAMKLFFYGIDADLDTSRDASNSFLNRVIFMSIQHDVYMRYQT